MYILHGKIFMIYGLMLKTWFYIFKFMDMKQ